MPELAKYARVVMPGGEQRIARIDRGDARLQASLPALPDCARV